MIVVSLSPDIKMKKQQQNDETLKQIFIWLGVFIIFLIVIGVILIINSGNDSNATDKDVEIIKKDETNEVAENEGCDFLGIDIFIWIIMGMVWFLIFNRRRGGRW